MKHRDIPYIKYNHQFIWHRSLTQMLRLNALNEKWKHLQMTQGSFYLNDKNQRLKEKFDIPLVLEPAVNSLYVVFDLTTS